MGWYLDGRATVVVGTHTHVPTADARVLPGGTAYITDVGMTGPRGGVIGVRKEQAIESLRTHMSVRFETSEDDPWLMGVLVRCADAPLRADVDRAAAAPLGAPSQAACKRGGAKDKAHLERGRPMCGHRSCGRSLLAMRHWSTVETIPLFASVPRRRHWHLARLADEVGCPPARS